MKTLKALLILFLIVVAIYAIATTGMIEAAPIRSLIGTDNIKLFLSVFPLQ